MDVVLHLADEYILDSVWAFLWPAHPRGVSPLAKAATPSQSAIANLSSHFAGWAGSSSNALFGGRQWESVAGKTVSALPRDSMIRQMISLSAITYVGIFALYFGFAGFSYFCFFNHDMKRHPRFLKNQVRLEIESSLAAFTPLTFMTLPWFVAEVRGYSKLYEKVSDMGLLYTILSVPFFLVFTDACIYWVHRLEHHPKLYKHIHKPHHKWLVPTPFASHAFHPVDGYMQSLPYHIFVFLFPLHRFVYMGLFVFVNCWSILIHDSDVIVNSPLETIINGPSHHTLHHLYFNVNYGQYFTGCDRLGGSYRQPKSSDDPLLDVSHGEDEDVAVVKAAKSGVKAKGIKSE
ncbi:hypothetical protein BCV69DRAFT_96701 [Microstroma glucosiphilum]|uniref:Fatty acid hydroxylase domain-containing protein n=1 Tax=Pseudomicrostroma glucosiphilum TaxID=1684307 RepID=A0A316UC11_9BASI|nr:hypothetical protein BCV69DRAFT_96701 [Pseudomicrostroma glucosiphilum]PWN22767.1 hypothetical protein BCV69DRAFT_96701 [Pseudomicrostroma glucosiphilum]